MQLVETIPRHGAALVRLMLVPPLSRRERWAWMLAREWPLAGAIAGVIALMAWGRAVPRAELDPLVVGGYLVVLLATRWLTRRVRPAVVRLEVTLNGD